MPIFTPAFDAAYFTQYRQATGVSHADLAAATGRSTWAIAAFESGTIAPSLVTVYALTKALRVPLGAFWATEPVEVPATPGFTASTASHLAFLAGALA